MKEKKNKSYAKHLNSWKNLLKSPTWAGKVAQGVKVPAAKLEFGPEAPHGGKGTETTFKSCSLTFSCTSWNVHPQSPEKINVKSTTWQ